MIFTLDGPDGIGKTTLVNKLKSIFSKKMIFTRAPGGPQSKVCSSIREIFLDDLEEIDKHSQYHLIWADFYQLFYNIVFPAIESKKHVFIERFITSTYVYQGHVNKGDPRRVIEESKYFFTTIFERVRKYLPIPLLYLTMEPKYLKARLENRNAELNRFDTFALNNIEKMVQYYIEAIRTLVMEIPGFIIPIVIDVSKDIDMIASEVVRKMEPFLGNKN